MPSDAFSNLGPRSLLDGMLALALVAAVLWLCAVATVWGRQERLIFRPDARPRVRYQQTSPQFGSARPVQDLDGLELAFWAAEPLPGMPTLLLFHGNAGNATVVLRRSHPLRRPATAWSSRSTAAMPEIRASFGGRLPPGCTGLPRLGRHDLAGLIANSLR